MKRILLAFLAWNVGMGLAGPAIAAPFNHAPLIDRRPCPYYQGGGFYRGWNGWQFYPHYRGLQPHYRGIRPLPYPCCGQEPAMAGAPVGGYYYDGEQIGPGTVIGHSGFGGPD